jgi:hypothetical protein
MDEGLMNAPAWTLRLKTLLGVDRAIAYSISARVWTVIGNIGTVLLMAHFLSPFEQGYYFTLISLAALQVIFELGFSFVVMQLAAHERAALVFFADGRVAGDAAAHARLASVLQLAVRWYARAGIAAGAFLWPLGIFFFSRSRPSGSHVRWFLPWLAAVLTSVCLFLQVPLCAFLEGCGEIRQVTRLRLCQCVAGTVLCWSCMLTGHGLFAPGMTMAASGAVGGGFLWSRRRFLLGLWHSPVGRHAVSWRREIWPFQWKIAISWLCAYFAVQMFTPLLFHYRNPVEAGRMGMSISVAGYLSAIALAWMTTKAPSFGQLAARREFARLDELFFRTLWQASSLLVLLAAGCMAAVLLLQRLSPGLGARLVAPRVFGLLLLGTVGSALVQSMAIYLRSFKREPFLLQSATVAALTLLGAGATATTMGAMGVAWSYFVCSGIVGPASAVVIFHSWRRSLTRTEMPAAALAGGDP